jgi:hypothetical protein
MSGALELEQEGVGPPLPADGLHRPVPRQQALGEQAGTVSAPAGRP